MFVMPRNRNGGEYKRIHRIPSGENRTSKKHVGASRNCLCKGHLAGTIIPRRLSLCGCSVFMLGISSLHTPMAGGVLSKLLPEKAIGQENRDSKSSLGMRRSNFSLGFLGKCPLEQHSQKRGHEL